MYEMKEDTEEEVIMVDDTDNIIGSVKRMTKFPARFRVSGLWVTNSKGDILLAKRAKWRDHDPGKWGPSAAGTNAVGETYESNIIKEAKEELGITLKDFKKGNKYDRINHFTQMFHTTMDEDEFTPNDEVEEIKWFTKEELKEELEKNPENFIKNLKYYFEEFTQ